MPNIKLYSSVKLITSKEWAKIQVGFSKLVHMSGSIKIEYNENLKIKYEPLARNR